MLDWDDLRIFLAVARAGSTLGAAKALGLNQSTVGRRVQSLERALGLGLFARRTTGYALTEHGRACLAQAEQVEAAVGAAEVAADRLRRFAATVVRVTAPESVFTHLVAPIVVAYRAERPEVTIAQVSSESHLDLAAGEADIAFRATELPMAGELIARKLPPFGWTAYCSRAYAEAQGLPATPGALAGHQIVLYDKPLDVTARNRWLAARTDPARVAARSNTVSNMRAILRAGMGIGLLPCVDGESDAALVRCFDPLPDFAGAWYLVMTPELHRIPAVRRFADFAVTRLVARRAFITTGRE